MSATVPRSQRALILPEKLGTFVIQTIDVPRPEEGEVLVRIESAALNPLDFKIQDDGIVIEEYPAILGLDAAGVVVEVAQGVTNLVKGDRVTFGSSYSNSRLGGFQQYAVAPADITFKIPSNVSFDEAATIPVGLATAFHGLYGDFIPDHERSGAELIPFWRWREGGRTKYSGEPIVVLSGSTSIGQYVIQLATRASFSPIITTASLHNSRLLKRLGVTHVIDRTLSVSQIVEEVRKITSKPVRIVYDAIGLPDVQECGYQILAPGGTLLTALTPEGNLDKAKAAAENKRIAFVYGQFTFPPLRKFAGELQSVVPAILENGELKTNVPEYIPGGLAGVAEGLQRLRENKVSGRKLVVRPPETK